MDTSLKEKVTHRKKGVESSKEWGTHGSQGRFQPWFGSQWQKGFQLKHGALGLGKKAYVIFVIMVCWKHWTWLDEVHNNARNMEQLQGDYS